MQMPQDMTHLFWDADKDLLDVETHRRYIIERILELGGKEELRWAFRTYGEGEILRVVRESRRLSRRTARCWQNFFGLDEGDMRCFGTYSTNPDGYF